MALGFAGTFGPLPPLPPGFDHAYPDPECVGLYRRIKVGKRGAALAWRVFFILDGQKIAWNLNIALDDLAAARAATARARAMAKEGRDPRPATAMRVFRGAKRKAALKFRPLSAPEHKRRALVARRAWDHSRERAKRSGVPHTVSLNHVVDLARLADICPCCADELDWSAKGQPTGKSPSLDRLLPRFGYADDNVEFICRRCNTLKRDEVDGDRLIMVGRYFNARLKRAIDELLS
jgi:hypothetical protein